MSAADSSEFRADMPFTGTHLRWPIVRRTRTFAVRVIEPEAYAPGGHSEVFNAVLSELFSPTPDPIDPLYPNGPGEAADPFDLVTFPEAFVPTEALLGALRYVGQLASVGCIHVGLRPS